MNYKYSAAANNPSASKYETGTEDSADFEPTQFI